MSDSPFEPPVASVKPGPESWVSKVIRLGIAFVVAAYAVLLLGVGVRMVPVWNARLDVGMIDEYAHFQAMFAAFVLCATGLVGMACAGLVVVVQRAARPAMLGFAVLGVVASFPVANLRVSLESSLEGGMAVLFLGTLVPLVCVLAYILLRALNPAGSESDEAMADPSATR